MHTAANVPPVFRHLEQEVTAYHGRGSSVGIVTRLGVGLLGFDPRQGQWRDFYSSLLRPDLIWGSPSLLSYG
jgi:hypothetical protein